MASSDDRRATPASQVPASAADDAGTEAGTSGESTVDGTPGEAADRTTEPLTDDIPPTPPDPRLPDDVGRHVLLLDRRNVWGVAWTIVGVIVLVQVLFFFLGRGSSFLYTVILAWLAAVAMEPPVATLSKRMRRGFATALVLTALVTGAVVFLILFGQLLAEQITRLIDQVPGWIRSVVTWLNEQFDADIDPTKILDSIGLTTEKLGNTAVDLAGGVITFALAVVASFFQVFVFGFFLFYFSADAPRLRRWVARMFPPSRQKVIGTVWDLAIQKTGGYVAARVVLAALSTTASAIFMLIIGMDYWLALAIWIGVISQFVPTIGTYIAIVLPVLIGALGPQPIHGLLVLIFALAYQQVENVVLEPRISGQAVGVHPAVSLGAVVLGTAVVGISGAFIAVPVAALLVALLEIYARQYEVLPEYAEMHPPDGRGFKQRLRRLLRRRRTARTDRDS